MPAFLKSAWRHVPANDPCFVLARPCQVRMIRVNTVGTVLHTAPPACQTVPTTCLKCHLVFFLPAITLSPESDGPTVLLKNIFKKRKIEEGGGGWRERKTKNPLWHVTTACVLSESVLSVHHLSTSLRAKYLCYQLIRHLCSLLTVSLSGSNLVTLLPL